jgi:crotonobetainyl-CoA:carnitine CoA-transferase CaiB-like acyl-CoA transferase
VSGRSGATHLPLSGLSVVELTGIEAVAYAGVLLGQLGASVVKIEGPTGDPMRSRPPLVSADDESVAASSVAFEFLNSGKLSMVLDHSIDGSLTAVLAEIGSADIVVADHLALLDLGIELPPRSTGQLTVFVGPYGGSPESAVPTSPLTRLHAGASGYIMPADADTTARPAWPGPYAFEAVHGVGLAVAIVSERARPDGGVVDYSLQAYGLWLEKLLYSRTSVRGIDFHRNTAVYPYGGNMQCQDGYVAILVLEERQWHGLCAMLGRPEWLADPRFTDGVARSTNRAPIAEELKQWCADHTVEEVIAAGATCDVPIGRVRRPGEVLGSEVLLDRDFFVPRDTEFGGVLVPSLPLGPQLRGNVSVRSPRLGDHVHPRP